MTEIKPVVLFRGKFHAVDSVDEFDPENPGQDGVTGSDIRQLDEQLNPKPEAAKPAQTELDDLSPEDAIKAIVAGGYEAEEENTNSVGTIAWLRAELAAMEVDDSDAEKLADYQALFLEAYKSLEA